MTEVQLKVVHDITQIERDAWDALLRLEDNPFVSWTFLESLENSGCVTAQRGWWPCHLTAWSEGELLAAAPAYVKGDSAGDFSRDWGLAESASRNGLSYYPKLVVGVPFSPVTGHRVLLRPELDRREMTRLLMALARELAKHAELPTIQVLYHHPDETDAFEQAGLASRLLIQYHWRNHGYASTEDWLSDLKSKKRTQVRREVKELSSQGIGIRTIRDGELEDRAPHWASLAWDLYARNCDKHFWGGTYLNKRFFERIFERLPEHVELVVAERGDRTVAGAFNLATDSHLFGRYWGCQEEHRFLHFNVCIYHSVDECIVRGIEVFEGGAGGEHKLARGFEPTAVHAAYSFQHRGFHDAVEDYLGAESRARLRELASWRARNGNRGA